MSAGLVWLVAGQPVHQMPPGWTGLTGHRDDSWRWNVLDLDGNLTGELTDAQISQDGVVEGGGVTGGSLDFNVNREPRGTGELTWVGRPGDAPSWDRIRLQPVYSATFPDGNAVEWPMGVFLASTPAETHGDGVVSVRADLYDKTLILAQDQLDNSWGLPAGAPVIPAVRSIIRASAGGPVAIDDATDVLRSPMVWEPGTSKLRMVNDLLSAAGYFAVWTDGVGAFRSSGYTPPLSRPAEWHFERGATSVYTPNYTHTRDTFGVPNKVILVSRGDGDAPGLRAVATIDDVDPAHPLSHASRRFWLTRFEEGEEATSQAVLDAKAARLRDEALQTSSTVQLQHAALPIAPNDHVTFVRATADEPLHGVLRTISIGCSPGALWESTILEVRS